MPIGAGAAELGSVSTCKFRKRGSDQLFSGSCVLTSMPRSERLEPAGVPLHVLQRGNNRAACFFGEVDRRFYLKCLAKAAARRGCAIHAYVLMPNHVHLLVTPAK